MVRCGTRVDHRDAPRRLGVLSPGLHHFVGTSVYRLPAPPYNKAGPLRLGYCLSVVHLGPWVPVMPLKMGPQRPVATRQARRNWMMVARKSKSRIDSVSQTQGDGDDQQRVGVGVALALGISVAVCGGNGGSGGSGGSAPVSPPVSAAAQCSALSGMTVSAASIGAPTNGATVTGATLVETSGEYRQVNGAIAPVDPAAPSINFQVNLPTNWHRKALHYGGGGFDGTLITGVEPLDMAPTGTFDTRAPVRRRKSRGVWSRRPRAVC